MRVRRERVRGDAQRIALGTMESCDLRSPRLSFAAGCSSATGTTDTRPSRSTTPAPRAASRWTSTAAATPPRRPTARPPAPRALCNYQAGTGCSGATPACIPRERLRRRRPRLRAAGAGRPGAACTQTSVGDCAAGYLCGPGRHATSSAAAATGRAATAPTEHCVRGPLVREPHGGKVSTGAMLCYPVGACDAARARRAAPSPGRPARSSTRPAPPRASRRAPAARASPAPARAASPASRSRWGATSAYRLCKAVPGGGAPYCQTARGPAPTTRAIRPGVGECGPPSTP